MRQREYGEVTTHETRGEAEKKVDKNLRYKQIIACLNEAPMTAKEIAYQMFRKGQIPTSERNFTAPRLNELMNKGIIEPIGKQKCVWTGRMVTIYSLRWDELCQTESSKKA